MAITEQSRDDLYQHLEATMGKERATTLMEHLPPVGWADVATRRDVEGLRHDVEGLRHDFAGLRQDFAGLKQDFAGLKQDFAGLRRDVAELRRDMDNRFVIVGDQFTVVREYFALMVQRFDGLATQSELHKVLRVHTLSMMAFFIPLIFAASKLN